LLTQNSKCCRKRRTFPTLPLSFAPASSPPSFCLVLTRSRVSRASKQ
jgi:hypothetical protein